MKKKGQIARMLITFVCGLSGCGGIFDETGSTSIVGVDEDQVFFQHFNTYSGWEVLPSSLWSMDLDSGQTRRIQDATIQAGPQAGGDYYVTELKRGDGTRGRLVGVQISTGRRMVIHERDLNWGTSFETQHLLNRDRVLFLGGEELILYDLVTGSITATIELPEGTSDLLAFGEDQAAIRLGDNAADEHAAVVNLDNGEILEFPPAPGNAQPFYLDTHLSHDWLVVSRFEQIDEQKSRNDILAFHIPTREWRVLAQSDTFEFDPASFSFLGSFVTGISESDVLVEHTNYDLLDGYSQLELIELETGIGAMIFEMPQSILTFSGFLSPALRGNEVFWNNPLLNALHVYNIQTENLETKLLPESFAN